MNNTLQNLAKIIKLVIFDVDGVLTDGKIYHSALGDELKAFHIHDGLGIKLLMQANIAVGIITSRQSLLVEKRMQELGVTHVYQGQKDKTHAFADLLQKLSLFPAQVAYVGDDLPDLALIQEAGLGIAVANAVSIVKAHAKWVTSQRGGEGAAREVSELILQAQGQLDKLHTTYLKS